MEKIEFKVDGKLVEGVSLQCLKHSYAKLDIVYAQNRLILLSTFKDSSTEDGYGYAIKVLENYCTMEDADKFIARGYKE